MDIRKFVKAFMLLVVFAFASVPQKIETKNWYQTDPGGAAIVTALAVIFTIGGILSLFIGPDLKPYPSVVKKWNAFKAKFKSDPKFRDETISTVLDKKIKDISVDDFVNLTSRFIEKEDDKASFKIALEAVATEKSGSAKKVVTLDNAIKVISESSVISQTNKTNLKKALEAFKTKTLREALDSVQPSDAIVVIKSVGAIPIFVPKESTSKEDVAEFEELVKEIKDTIVKQVIAPEIGQHPLDWALAMNKLTGGKFLEDALQKALKEEKALEGKETKSSVEKEVKYSEFLKGIKELSSGNLNPADWQAKYAELTKQLVNENLKNKLVDDIAGAYIKLPTLSPENQKIFDVFERVMSLSAFDLQKYLPGEHGVGKLLEFRAKMMDGFVHATEDGLNALAEKVEEGKAMDADEKKAFIKNLNKFAEPAADGQRVVDVVGSGHGSTRGGVAGSDIVGTRVDTDPETHVEPAARTVVDA